MQLILSSRNAKKLRELAALLGDLPLSLSDLTPFPAAPPVEETGATFAENAALKATAVAKALGLWTLGEDSGLVVPALGGGPRGEPGVDSALYAGVHGDDAANNAKLLSRMANLSGDDRRAYYVSTTALSNPAGEVVAAGEGRCWGVIATERRGGGGFGYDPLFVVSEYHQSFGELSAVVKQALSHRARAVERVRPAVRRFVLAGPS